MRELASGNGCRLQLHEKGELFPEGAKARLNAILAKEASDKLRDAAQLLLDDNYRRWLIYGPSHNADTIPSVDRERILKDPWVQKRLKRQQSMVTIVLVNPVTMPRWAQRLCERLGWLKKFSYYTMNLTYPKFENVMDATALRPFAVRKSEADRAR
jgi:hypothetical protein